MLQNSLLKIEDKAYGLIVPLFLIYIFFQPFNHFAGIRNTAFYSMLLLFLIKIARKGIKPAPEGFNQLVNWKDSVITALFILLAAVLISILFSNYKMDSLNAFRKNFLNQIVVFFVILVEFKDTEKLKALLSAVVFSFITVTLIIFIKNPPDSLFNILEAKKYKESFLGGYALNAAFYIPFTLGYLFSIKGRISIKAFFWIMVLAEFILVWLYYSSRTTLAAVLVSSIIMILMSKRYKMIAVVIVIFLGLGGISYFKKPELLDRYKTMLSFQTYTSNVGLSGRGDIWRGAVDMIKDSPIIGYGYGWKKIATVARGSGYLEKWREKMPGTYDYFNKAGYGAANPHNLVLQILFEAGILGLLAFILFWSAVIIKVVKIIKSGGVSELDYFVRYGMPGVLITYFIINITNGLWEETYGILTFTLAAVVLVIYERNKDREC